jgi:hypothetical protein
MRFAPVVIGLCLTGARLSGQSSPPHVAIGPNTRLVPGEFIEPWIAASSTNRNVLIAAAHLASNSITNMNVTTVISRDGGRSWVPVQLPGGTSGFDPMVASGPNGRLYVLTGQRSAGYAARYATLSGSSPVLRYPDAKALHRVWSAAGEAWSWDGPTVLESLVEPDHARMVADMTQGPRRGRLYVVWNDAVDVLVPDQYEVFLQHSDDGGKTFSERQLVDSKVGGKLVATEPVVLSDGTLLVTYYQYFFPMSDRRNAGWPFFVRRSTDGGRSFGPVETAFELGPHLWPDVAGPFGGFILPIVVADSSAASPHRDNVYVTWDDVRGGESNIWLVRSTDHGRTWSRPIRVNDNRPSGLDVKDYRMIPTVAVNHRGAIAVSWYDRRNDPTHQCWEYFVAVSTDGGVTFSPNRAVSTAPSCPPPNLAPIVPVNNLSQPRDPNRPPDSVLARMSTVEQLLALGDAPDRAARAEAAKGLPNGRINLSFSPARSVGVGDYSGLAADVEGVFHALWIDRRNGGSELYTARIALTEAPRSDRGAEQDVTGRVEIVAGTATFDRARGLVQFPLQLRNVSSEPIYGPIAIRVVQVKETAGQPSASFADSAAGRGKAPSFSFEGRLGTENLLDPLDLSEPIVVSIKTRAATGWDTALDVRVIGRVRR